MQLIIYFFHLPGPDRHPNPNSHPNPEWNPTLFLTVTQILTQLVCIYVCTHTLIRHLILTLTLTVIFTVTPTIIAEMNNSAPPLRNHHLASRTAGCTRPARAQGGDYEGEG